MNHPSISFPGKSQALSQAGLRGSAQSVAVEPAALWTVLAVETSGCGFIADRRPQILYERHIFHRLTGGRFDDGDISSPDPGGYGPAGAHQYDRLNRAIALDRTAALQSASWGVGQIMGENYAMAGFPDVEGMVAAMADSEDAQLAAVASFLTKSNMASFLRNRDWASFAAKYNGPNYAINQYDVKLGDAFKKYSSGGMPDLNARAAQLYLTFLGHGPGPVDGEPGLLTHAAVMSFQQKHNLPATGAIDDNLLALLLSSF